MDPDRIAAGKYWKRQQDGLNENSFIELKDKVAVRCSHQFVNHLYDTPQGKAACVVTYDTNRNGITVSICDPIPGIHIGNILKEVLKDPRAGGKDVIGGSPYETKSSLTDLTAVVEYMRRILQETL
jgi:hypothetical protein